MLELAAKAAGIERGEERTDCGISTTLPDGRHGYLTRWDPLTDDGDALRLAVALRMEIDHNHPADHTPWASVRAWASQQTCSVEEFDDEGQRGAATRRAITRAAAEIGRQQHDTQ